MQVIIVGCGKVGRNLAEQLQAEDIDITLVDVIADKINDLCENIDAMGIVGNGASINTLMEAGVDTADILIAVTASDELNLLCCLIAQKANHCQTIARVRNPIYEKEIGFIKERLGVTMIINPELAAAQENANPGPAHAIAYPARTGRTTARLVAGDPAARTCPTLVADGPPGYSAGAPITARRHLAG